MQVPKKSPSCGATNATRQATENGRAVSRQVILLSRAEPAYRELPSGRVVAMTLRAVRAEERERKRANRSPAAQLALLDKRLGAGVGAVRERARLAAQVEKSKAKATKQTFVPVVQLDRTSLS